jgi:spermidine dehydrogenase
MDDLGTAQVNYAILDTPAHPVRIRLSSTVLNVHQEGPKGKETGVVVTYSTGGKMYTVRGKGCVMACWNMFIPYLIPDLPAEQKAALSYAVKGPIMYTSVAVKNWHAWKEAGLSSISAPTMYHPSVALTEAVSLGDMTHAKSPDDPIFLHLVKIFAVPGRPRQEQHRLGRFEVLNTPFETMERSIRDQLNRMLGPYGFDAKRDIVDITCNRWPHGYAYTYNGLNEPLDWVYTASDSRPCVIARKTYGLVAIANSDAGASPHTDTAIWEGWRATDEIINRRAMPFLA